MKRHHGGFFGATERDLTGLRFELSVYLKLVLFQGLIHQKKSPPSHSAEVFRNAVSVGCLCALCSTLHIVHHSADRALSFLFRLSRTNVGSINDDIRVPSLL